MTRDLTFVLNISVNEDAVDTIKNAAENHIDTLMKFEDWPDITGFWDAKVYNAEEVVVKKYRPAPPINK